MQGDFFFSIFEWSLCLKVFALQFLGNVTVFFVKTGRSLFIAATT